MKEFTKLLEIVNKLREPEKGCPWDLKQTPESLVPNFIEELYEVIEAIELDDYQGLKEELGDLILHIVMQVRMAEEKKQFYMNEVLDYINQKLIRRHPHIFGKSKISDSKAVKDNWEKIKMKEKKHRKSVLEGIPHSMPALIVAERMQEKAAAVGFDWEDHESVFAKIKEEIAEFEEEYQNKDKTEMTSELGDMIFAIVNLARKLNIDAESALRMTIRKFENRFKYIEEYHKENKEDINKSSLEKLDEIWENSKKFHK